ncbi:MAG: hypothetical protein IKW74_00630 [Thermoguttaceae bacterium]|nr:hypothetical protein [Thermoguttaceae bacterium]
MGEKLSCFLISAVVGAISAVGMVWFLSGHLPEKEQFDASINTGSPQQKQNAAFEQIEVNSLKVNSAIIICDSQTGEPVIELRNGSIFAQKGIFAERIGGMKLSTQKIQITPENPLIDDYPVFGEFATNSDGGGYFSLLSAKGTHSLNVGFDNNEQGYIISQNNMDKSLVAQAILPCPSAENMPDQTTSSPNATAKTAPTPANSVIAPVSADTPATENMMVPNTGQLPRDSSNINPVPASDNTANSATAKSPVLSGTQQNSAAPINSQPPLSNAIPVENQSAVPLPPTPVNPQLQVPVESGNVLIPNRNLF